MTYEIIVQGDIVATVSIEDTHPLARRVADIVPYITPAAALRRQKLTKVQFLRRFTPEERIGIRAAATNDQIVADFLAMLDLAEEVIPNDPDTVAALDYLAQLNLLQPARKAAILAN